MEEIKGEIKEAVSEKGIEKRKNKLKSFFFGWIKDNYDKAFILVLILALALRIWVYFLTKNQAMWFDAAEYLSTAKYWAGVANLTDMWYFRRGFFWPLFCAAFFKLGLGEKTIDVISILFSTGTVAVSYFLIRDMFNKKYALFSCIGLTFSWVFLFFTGRPSNEIPATFFLLLSLLFFWGGYEMNKGKRYIYLSSFFLAISVLTRMENLIFIPLFFVLILIKEKFAFIKNKSLWVALLIFAFIMSPFFVMYFQHFGNPVTDIMAHYFGIGKGNGAISTPTSGTFSLASIFTEVNDLPYNLTIPIFVLFLIGIFYFFMDLFLGFDKIAKDKLLQNKLFVFFWILFPLLVLGYMDHSGPPQERYTIMLHPFLFMIAAIPLFEIGKIAEKYIKKNKKSLSFLIILLFIIALLPNLSWGYQLIENKVISYQEVMWAGQWVKQNSNSNDIIITNDYPIISYYSDRRIATFEQGLENPEDHNSTSFNESEFYNFVIKEKPNFLILSVFDPMPGWALNFTQEYNNTWVPVQGYKEGDRPVLVIYKSNFNSSV